MANAVFAPYIYNDVYDYNRSLQRPYFWYDDRAFTYAFSY